MKKHNKFKCSDNNLLFNSSELMSIHYDEIHEKKNSQNNINNRKDLFQNNIINIPKKEDKDDFKKKEKEEIEKRKRDELRKLEEAKKIQEEEEWKKQDELRRQEEKKLLEEKIKRQIDEKQRQAKRGRKALTIEIRSANRGR